MDKRTQGKLQKLKILSISLIIIEKLLGIEFGVLDFIFLSAIFFFTIKILAEKFKEIKQLSYLITQF